MSRKHPLLRRRTSKSSSVKSAVAPPSQIESGSRSLLKALLLLILLGLVLTAVVFWWAQSQPPATFLIVGVDQRVAETGPTRADVIMLLHVDPAHADAGLISIPRDLWLPQPGGTTNRINTALAVGYDAANPNAAPHYLAETLAANFDLSVDGYFLLNFDAFVAVIDAVGGVTVDVPVTIVDEAYPTADYGVQTIRFDAGPQHLDGDEALIYVRTRHQDSDFGRAARQQQVLQSLAAKVLNPRHWLRLPALAAAILRNTQTDLAPGQWPALGLAALYLARGDVQTLVLNQEYVDPWTTESGAYVLLPRWAAIEPAIYQIVNRVE